MTNNDQGLHLGLHWVAVHILAAEGMSRGAGNHKFSRVPQVGEFVCLESSEKWHEVLAVVHCPFETECVAEIYTDGAGVSEFDVLTALKARKSA